MSTPIFSLWLKGALILSYSKRSRHTSLPILDIWAWFSTSNAKFLKSMVEKLNRFHMLFLKLMKIGGVKYGQKLNRKYRLLFSWCSLLEIKTLFKLKGSIKFRPSKSYEYLH